MWGGCARQGFRAVQYIVNVGFVFVSVVNWVDFGEMGWMWVKLGGFD